MFSNIPFAAKLLLATAYVVDDIFFLHRYPNGSTVPKSEKIRKEKRVSILRYQIEKK